MAKKTVTPVQAGPVLTQVRQTGGPLTTSTMVMLSLTAGLAGSIAVTQRLASGFGYDPRLGAPLLRLPDGQSGLASLAAVGLGFVGLNLLRDAERRRKAGPLLMGAVLLYVAAQSPIYSPARVLEWWPQIKTMPQFADLRASALMWGFGVFSAAGLGMLCAVREPRTRRASHSGGSAEWGHGDALRQSKEDLERMIREKGKGTGGLLIGRHADGSLLWYPGASHAITMAPTRSGKGIGTVVPQLLTYPGSCVCTDTKAENFYITAKHRQMRLGQTVYALDPFNLTNNSPMRARFNPLSTIETQGSRAALARDDAQTLAEALILGENGGNNRHWTDEGRTLLAGIMIYVCHCYDTDTDETELMDTPYGRDLMTVRYLMTLPEAKFEELLERMGTCGHTQVKRAAAILKQKDLKERSGVVSSTQSQLGFLDSPAMAEVLAERIDGKPNPVREADLFSIKLKPTTVYLVIPPKYLESHAAWLRLMIIACNDIITRTPRMPQYRVLFLLDEFANLGRMEPIRRGVSLIGGYGVAFWLIVQDLSQVEAVYEKGWGTMFANCDVRQLFGTNDLRTGKEISEYMGKTTVYSDSGNTGKSADASGMDRKGSSFGEGKSEKERPLLYPDEVLRLDPSLQLLMVRGQNPMRLQKLNYLEMPELSGMFEANPMYAR